MRRPAYNSPAVPINWPRIDYCSGTNEIVEIAPNLKQQVLDFYKQDPEAAKAQFGENPFEVSNVMKYWVRSKNSDMHVIPTDTLYITVDKEAVRKSGMLMACDTIPDRMVISLANKKALYKNDLMMLEMIANCNWTRPIYIASTVAQSAYMNLGDNFVFEGLANRVTPFLTNAKGAKTIDTEKTYNNVMNRYRYGGLSVPGLYVDETLMRMCYTHRRIFGQLALSLLAEGKNDKALKVLQKGEKEIPECNVPMNYMSGALDFAQAYAYLGKNQKALQLINTLWKDADQYATYYLSLEGTRFTSANRDFMIQLTILNQINEVTQRVDSKLAAKRNAEIQSKLNQYIGKGGQPM